MKVTDIGKTACIIIAHDKRPPHIRGACIDSAIKAGFDEVIVVGDWCEGEGYRYLPVPTMTGTTLDALIKRDVGTLATDADILVYLADDHAINCSWFAKVCKEKARQQGWDVLVPTRWAQHPEQGMVRVPNGEEGIYTQLYCAGHCGVFRRRVVTARPWTAQPHHRNWDLLASIEQQVAGALFHVEPSLEILDLEPERAPWK